MNTRITLCRDIEEPTSTECIEDHEEIGEPLVAPCKVMKDICDLPQASEHVGAEAESSATYLGEMTVQDCCDC